MSQSLFLVVAVLGLFAALGTVLARNLVHAALYLVAYFFVIACQFVMLEAEFLAAIQVLVYVGAVAILLMFGIMLTRNVQGDDTTTVPVGLAAPALIATLGLFFVLAYGVNNHAGLSGQGSWAGMTRRSAVSDTARYQAVNDMGRAVGNEMLQRYALPFEVAGLLLTAALVGAVALAHRDVAEDTPARGGGAGGHNTAGGPNAPATAAAWSASPPLPPSSDLT